MKRCAISVALSFLLMASCSVYSIYAPANWPEREFDNLITEFSFLAENNSASSLSVDIIGTIKENVIRVDVPYGTDLSALVATFTMTGSDIRVSSEIQSSGITPNNFSADLVYRVTAKEGAPRDYVVRVYSSVDETQLEDMITAGQDITRLDTSGITDMSNLFDGNISFNQDIGDWDTSHVVNMDNMFRGAEGFNQDLGKWDVSNVTSMASMFYRAIDFNQDIGDWDVSNVTSMSYMFWGALLFNQNLRPWANHIAEDTNHAGFSNGECPLIEAFHPYDSWE